MSRADLRIVSLIPSGTEIVAALGLAERLVGRSHECDFPQGVGRLPALTQPMIDTAGEAARIDAEVRELLRSALSIYRLDVEALGRLKPTHIVTQDQCAVCAVDLAEVERAAQALTGCDTRVISLEPQRLDDLWADLVRVGEVLGSDGEKVARELEARVGAIADKAAGIPPERRKRVACIEWTDPLMAAGNWVPELVALAGGEDILGVAGAHAPRLEGETLANARPEVVLFMPCGFDLARTRREAAAVLGKPVWLALPATARGELYATDGNQYFNRPGPRLVESLEIVAEILDPESFHFGHEGSGWERLRSRSEEGRGV